MFVSTMQLRYKTNTVNNANGRHILTNAKF